MRTARTAWVVPVVLLGVLSACGGGDEAPTDEPAEAPPTAVAKLSDIPNVQLLVEPEAPDAPKTYRTGEITAAEASAPDASTVNVNYESGPDVCAEFAGYAMQESDATIEVTVIVGEQAGCTGKSTLRTTVLNTDEPVGDRDVVVSEYSEQSIPVEDPTA